MSVEYFLHCKDKQEIIKVHLKEIIHTYDDLIKKAETQPTQNEYNKDEDINLFITIQESYIKNLNETIAFCEALDKIITQTLCDHNYITDLIDITPEKSQNISYCQKCEHTKE